MTNDFFLNSFDPSFLDLITPVWPYPGQGLRAFTFNPLTGSNGPPFNPLHPALPTGTELALNGSTSSPPANSTPNILTPITPNGTTSINTLNPNILSGTFNGINPTDWPSISKTTDISALQAAAAAAMANLSSWRPGLLFLPFCLM